MWPGCRRHTRPGECFFSLSAPEPLTPSPGTCSCPPTATAPRLTPRPMIDKVEVVHADVVQTDGLLVDLALVCITQTPGR